MPNPPLAITAGEPAGIGFDIILKSLDRLDDCVVIADQDALLQRAKQLNVEVQLTEQAPKTANQLHLHHIATHNPVTCGQLNKDNARYVLNCLDHAIDNTLAGRYAGIVTAPLHKGIINDAGIAFTGHTEYLAERASAEVVMLLVAEDVRVALATTHLPLREVADSITTELLIQTITILSNDLEHKFGLEKPHIKVCGLNPHAGEQGHLGKEDQELIVPAVTELTKRGLNISGPYPADTVFTPKHLEDADAVIAMYHDQGLPVLKHIGFGHAVNTTLGLPFIRTSVDHGTALDLAGTGHCDPGSLQAAIELARQQAQHIID